MRKTTWQDIVFMIGGFILVPSLIFSIGYKIEIPLATSLPTAIVLTSFAFCFATLKLKLAAFTTGLTAICWYILIFI